MVDSLADVLTRLRSCEWIDLTHTFGPDLPHFLAHRFTHIGQWGTHVDLPPHFARGGRFLDELPVTDMILPLVVLDVRRHVAQAAAGLRLARTGLRDRRPLRVTGSRMAQVQGLRVATSHGVRDRLSGSVLTVHLSVPATLFACVRRPVGVLVALVLGLACTLLWLMALSAPGMNDIGRMVDEPGVSMTAGLREVTATAARTPGVAADLATDLGSAMTSMCDSTCVSQVTDMCALAAGLIITTVMALLVSSRRHTFLGLLARPRGSAPVPRSRWLRTPWTSPSLSLLGVLRV